MSDARREAFEAHILSDTGMSQQTLVALRNHGGYQSDILDGKWRAWRAAVEACAGIAEDFVQVAEPGPGAVTTQRQHWYKIAAKRVAAKIRALADTQPGTDAGEEKREL